MNTHNAALPTTPRLAPRRLGLAALIVGAILTGMVVMSLLQRQRVAETPPAPPLPPLYEVSGEGDALQRLQLKTSWAGEDRSPKPPPPPPQAPPVMPPPPPLFPAQATPVVQPLPALQPAPQVVTTPAQSPAPAVRTAPVQPLAAPRGPAKPAAQDKPEDKDWLFADVKGSSRTRQGRGGSQGADGSPGERRSAQSSLFPAAQWERPARPERVIYQSQILHGLLSQAIKTGQDGTIRVEVTETLYDKFGQLTVLIPQHGVILGKVAGASVKAGQTTVPITITKVELPDGTDLPLAGNMGGADGIAGVPASRIDNRIPQVVLTALLTAVTSIGTRSITGSTQGYQPDLGQEYTADVAQSLSRSGQKMVERALSIDPVIWVDAQTPVTIQLDGAISLQSPPKIVHR
jgi:type IV secretory pathway VirB10-like protein